MGEMSNAWLLKEVFYTDKLGEELVYSNENEIVPLVRDNLH